jgi:hypothetical protein
MRLARFALAVVGAVALAGRALATPPMSGLSYDCSYGTTQEGMGLAILQVAEAPPDGTSGVKGIVGACIQYEPGYDLATHPEIAPFIQLLPDGSVWRQPDGTPVLVPNKPDQYVCLCVHVPHEGGYPRGSQYLYIRVPSPGEFFGVATCSCELEHSGEYNGPRRVVR